MLAELRDATRRLFGSKQTASADAAKAVDPVIAGVVQPEPIRDLAELVCDMRKDPMVVITQDVLLSSVKRGDVTINVDAPEGDATAEAIEDDLNRLWLETLEKFCDPEHGVFTWGGLPFELVIENDEVSGVPITVIKQFKQLPKHINGARATELVLDSSGQFGGIRVTIDGSDFVIPPEQSCWFAISATPLEPHGRSLFLGAPAEVRKRRKETDQLIQVFVARWAVDGPTIHAPATAVDETGRVVNNHKLIAAQYHANKTAGGLTILPNDAHSTPGMEGKYQIDITHEARSLDAKPLEIIDNLIDAKMSRAFGVHESVTMDTETGSYASQTVRMFVVLSKCDSLGSQLTSQFEAIVNRVYGPANYPGKPPKITVTPTSRITDGLMVETVKAIMAMPQWGPLLESGAIDVATILANAGVPLARDYVERLDAAFAQVKADKQAMREQTQQQYGPNADPLFQANEPYELAVKKKSDALRSVLDVMS